jgi:hypothetical protein
VKWREWLKDGSNRRVVDRQTYLIARRECNSGPNRIQANQSPKYCWVGDIDPANDKKRTIQCHEQNNTADPSL